MLRQISMTGISSLFLLIQNVAVAEGDFSATIRRDGFFQLSMSAPLSIKTQPEYLIQKITFDEELLKASDTFVDDLEILNKTDSDAASKFKVKTKIQVGKIIKVSSFANFDCILPKTVSEEKILDQDSTKSMEEEKAVISSKYTGTRKCNMTNERVMTGKFHALTEDVLCSSNQQCQYKLIGKAKDIDYVVIAFSKDYVGASLVETSIARFWAMTNIIDAGVDKTQYEQIGQKVRSTKYFKDHVDRIGDQVREFFKKQENCIQLSIKGTGQAVQYTCTKTAPVVASTVTP